MKKGNVALLSFLILSSVSGLAEEKITVQLNGEELSFEKEPFIEDGTTLVPMRAIFEGLGAEVEWDGDNRSITSRKDDTTIYMEIGSYNMKVNDSIIELAKCPDIFDDFTFVPLRAVAEAFDAKVEWNGETQTVTIENYNTIAETPEPTIEPTVEHTETPRPVPTPIPAQISPKYVKSAFHVKFFTDSDAHISVTFYGKELEEIEKNGIQEYGVKIRPKSEKNGKWSKMVVLPENMREKEYGLEKEMTYDVFASDYGIKIDPETEYVLQPYVVSEYMEYRTAQKEAISMPKKEAEEFRVNVKIEDVFSDNAVIQGIYNDSSQFVHAYDMGLYIGESEDEMIKYGDIIRKLEGRTDTVRKQEMVYHGPVEYNSFTYRTSYIKYGNNYYDVNLKEKLGIELKPDTTYYCKFYVKWGAAEKSSEILSFTTLSE